jgi:hypothetical protein
VKCEIMSEERRGRTEFDKDTKAWTTDAQRSTPINKWNFAFIVMILESEQEKEIAQKRTFFF